MVQNFKPIFYNKYCRRENKWTLIHVLEMKAQGNWGYRSLLICVNIILNEIIWELALEFVTAVLFINTPIKIHSICSSNTLCIGLYFLGQTEALNWKLKFI